MTAVSSENEHGEASQQNAAEDAVSSGGTTVADERPPERNRAWDDGLIARRAAFTPPGEVVAPRVTTDVAEPAEEAEEEPAEEVEEEVAAELAEEPAEEIPDEPAEDVPWPLEPALLPEGDAVAPPPEREEHSGAPMSSETVPVPAQSEAAPIASPQPPPAAAPRVEHSVDFGNPELRQRLGALRELIGLSSTRLDGDVLAEAGRVLDEAGARGRLPRTCTTVAIAGATGSGKSTLFNALAGERLSQAGTNRPTTASPVACSWVRPGGGADAEGLLDRLGIGPPARRRVSAQDLDGLVLIDLPDHDAAAEGHREQVDRLLKLVDAVVWVVDPEKYADAVLHERYLRPLAGYAEVTFVVLNQTDRLPGEAADIVLDDLRRLLDEDGMALGEHGEPGARVMSLSALTGAGVDELREELGAFVAEARAPALRLRADLDGAVGRLRPVYADPGPGWDLDGPAGMTDAAREEFADRLAASVGAVAAGLAAERAWLRNAEQACGTPWSQLAQGYDLRRAGRKAAEVHVADLTPEPGEEDAADESLAEPPSVARHVVSQAVRELAETVSEGLPDAWRRAVRDAARRGADGLPEALDDVLREADGNGELPSRRPNVTTGLGRTTDGTRMFRPAWWPAASVVQGVLLVLQLVGVVWLLGTAAGLVGGTAWLPAAMLAGGSAGGVLLAWACRAAARGPARRYGQREEGRLRRLAAGCGRSWVEEPVTAELVRYRDVREQYVIAAGGSDGY